MMAAAVKKKKRSDPARTRPEARRSLRPRQCRYLADLEDELDLDLDLEREKKEKESRKLKLVLKLPPTSSPLTAPRSRKVGIVSRHVSSSDSATSSDDDDDAEEDEEIVKPLKKRRFEKAGVSEGSGQREGSKKNAIRRTIRAVSGTPMPEKSTLEEILDKLQKKDTYGVFAEPVDPKELPDYHDVIEHPMDFGTVRRKLASGRYRCFEQFEDDVFLICSNAMQYNAPDTVYFRQAHSIQDTARKNFQEIRADLTCIEAGRESKENIRSASTEKRIVKKLQCGVAPKPSSFDVTSLEKKTAREPQSTNAFKPLGCDISFMQKKTIKKQFRTAPEARGFSASSMEEKTPKKPQYKTLPGQPGSNVSSIEKKTVKKPEYRSAQEPPCSDASYIEKKTVNKSQYRSVPKQWGSDVSSIERKTIKKPLYRSANEPQCSDVFSLEKLEVKKPQYRSAHEQSGSDVVSMEKKKVKKPQYRSAHEQLGSGVSSMEKKKVKKPQDRTSPEPLDSDTSSMEKKKVKKPQDRTSLEPLDSDTSSMEKKKVKKPQDRTSTEPLDSDTSSMEKMILKNTWKKIGPQPLSSDISSQDKKTQKEPLGSDISSGTTLASAADTFTGLDTLPANGDASAADQRKGLSTVQAGGNFLEADTSTELTTVKANGIERSITINGSADGSSPGDSNPEKADEVAAKCSPSKLAKPFVVDMNRRLTYNSLDDQPLGDTDSVFDVFEGETRQLVTVGLDSEYSYARSLARFAASLGPAAWDIASKKIEQSLPPGVKFGPGWVGEYESPLTPILSLESKNQRKEAKSEAMSTVSKTKKGNERNGQHKDAPFSPRSKMTTGMPSNSTPNASIEERERIREQELGLFGVNLEPQPSSSSSSSSSALQQHQQNQPASGMVKAYTNETAGHRLDIGSEGAKSTFPAKVSKGWSQVQAEPQKSQQQKGQVAQVQAQPIKPQQQKNQVASDLAKASANETTMHQPKLLYSEGAVSNIPALSYMGRTQVQTELLRRPEAVTSQRMNGDLGMNIGGLNNWKSCDIRMNSPYGIISHHQAGVQYWVPRPNQEQAVSNSLRWVNSNRCTNNLDHSMLHIPKSENLNAAPLAAAQAWMSIGVSNKQFCGSAPFNSTWKNPNPASRVHEEARIKPEPLQLMTTDLSRLQAPWQGLVPHNKQKDTLPPDLNISFQPSGSPSRSSSSIHMDTQQPDLALQL